MFFLSVNVFAIGLFKSLSSLKQNQFWLAFSVFNLPSAGEKNNVEVIPTILLLCVFIIRVVIWTLLSFVPAEQFLKLVIYYLYSLVWTGLKIWYIYMSVHIFSFLNMHIW